MDSILKSNYGCKHSCSPGTRVQRALRVTVLKLEYVWETVVQGHTPKFSFKYYFIFSIIFVFLTKDVRVFLYKCGAISFNTAHMHEFLCG
jgi:hypothetical protein